MKTRERLAKMRQSERFGEKFMLANDMVPGTKFDAEIRAAKLYSRDNSDEDQRASNEVYQQFQHEMLSAIRRRDSKLFRELADALDQHRSHARNPDRMRKELLWYSANIGQPISVKAFLELYGDRYRNPDLHNNDEAKRTVRRLCDELGIQFKGPIGRPKTRTKRR